MRESCGIGYFAQHQVEQLDLEANALLTMQRLDSSLSEREIRGYLGGFNFRGEKVIASGENLFWRAEGAPGAGLTDLATPQPVVAGRTHQSPGSGNAPGLNQALQGFAGSVILVSHDRPPAAQRLR